LPFLKAKGVDVAAFIEKEEEAEERFQAGINKYK
jgi:hypothetical protein